MTSMEMTVNDLGLTCSQCGTPLTDKNWSQAWQRKNYAACTGCSKKYNDQTNGQRMYVNGKYIPNNHPLHKPGRYKALGDAWSHEKIESVKEGEVYAITNPAWPEWIKIGKAVNTADRLNGYHTSSPFRDYEIGYFIETDNRHKSEREIHKLMEGVADDRAGEWFKVNMKEVKYIFNLYKEQNSKENDDTTGSK